jgi:UDP-glucose 4-epimerase
LGKEAVLCGKLEELFVYGDDYPTKNGTGVRGYIHVFDLAKGYIHALKKLEINPEMIVHNLHSGQNYIVLDLVKGIENVSGRPVPYQFVYRTSGDIAACYADPTKTQK